MKQKPIAVVAGARTPFSKVFTELQEVSAVELGRLALLDSLRRCGLSGADIDEVVMGNVAGPPDAANIGVGPSVKIPRQGEYQSDLHWFGWL